MDRARAIEEIRAAADMRDYLEPAGGGGQYVCPFCGSGSHGHGSTAAFHYYPETNTAACFSTACTEGMSTGKSYDVFDVVEKYYNTDFNGALGILADKLGIEIDGAAKGINAPPKAKNPAGGEFGPNKKAAGAAESEAFDHTEYYKECAARLDDPRAVSYITGRGISLETAKRYGLGFDPAADPINDPGGRGTSRYPEPRIIIPINKYHYVARAFRTIKSNGNDYTKPHNKGSKGHLGLFNAACLYDRDKRPIFVTEGVFDALSLLELGYKAIALNSANMAHLLIETIEKHEPTGATHFIICLDNDERGRAAVRTLTGGLSSYIIGNVSEPYKDPNEHLVTDRDSFLMAVQSAVERKPINTGDHYGRWLGMHAIRRETADAAGFSYSASKQGVTIPCGDTAAAFLPVFSAAKAEYTAQSIAAPFGLDAATQDARKRPIFVVWQVLDALAVMEEGYNAIALCEPQTADFTVSKLIEEKPAAPIILAVTGGTRDRLRQDLSAAGMTVYTADLRGSYASVWRYRILNHDEFKTVLDAATEGEATAAADYINTCLVDDIENYQTDIKTGFANYDLETGGLYSGLYIIGAISSLGKTTFAHQMADQIAAAGGHVLFFSLEQSRFELITKSIARQSYLTDAAHAHSAMDIRRMKGNMDLFTAQCAGEYSKKVGNRLQIYQSTMEATAGQIEQTAREYMAREKVTPVIIVDYLQVLQPEPDAVQTDIRSTVDAALRRFKRLAATADTPVILISSLNRQNYNSPIDFSAFKESGNVEYSGDVVIGLQLEVMNSKIYASDKKEINKRLLAEIAKNKIPRRIEAKVLKNRYGFTRFSLYYEYNPIYDTFVPCERMTAEEFAALEKEAEKTANEKAKAAAKSIIL